VTAFSTFEAWLIKGMDGTSFCATLLLIGYVVLLCVIIGNIIATATDRKRGVYAIR
jgi:hypothetical protein